MTDNATDSPYATGRSNALSAGAQVNSVASRVRVIAAMYVGYAMFMVLRMAPTVAGTSITADATLGVDTGDWGRILAMGTIGAVIGKFIGGYSADRLGGRITFAAGLLLSAIGVAAFAVSYSAAMFQASFFVALMAKSAGWPSMTRIIVAAFRPSEYGRVWGVLATSSRVGTLLATLCLGGLLSVVSWRWMLVVAAIGGGAVAVAFFFALRQTQVQAQLIAPDQQSDADQHSGTAAGASADSQHLLDGTTLQAAILHFLSSRRFWLITISLMALTIMWDFLLMVPLYLEQTMGMTPAAASMASSAFPFGSLISVLAGGFVFDSLSRRSTAWLMGGLLTVAVGCILVFFAMPELDLSANASRNTSMVLLFVFGLCVSPCYYIPMSVFSIEFGGPHSGFLVALLDAIAFGATAVFYYYAGEIAEQSWSTFLQLLAGVAVIGVVATFAFMMGESRQTRLVAADTSS